MRWHGLTWAVALASCGPSVEPGGDGGQDGSSTMGSTSAVSITSGLDSSGADTTGSLPPPLTTSSGDSTTGDPLSVCDPQPTGAVAWVTVSEMPAEPVVPTVFTACTLTELSSEEVVHTLSFECAEGSPTVELGFPYLLQLGLDETYELRVWWTQITFEGGDLFVSLTDSSGQPVVVAGIGPVLPGEAGVPADFAAPITVERLGDVCEPEPPNESDFVGECYQSEREALRIGVDGSTVDVYDGTQDFVAGPYAASVAAAEERHVIICSDVPGRWYQWVVAQPFLR